MPWGGGGEGRVATAVLDEPMQLEPLYDPTYERSVLIYDSEGRRIITAIEILSPWNKTAGSAVETYLEKRRKYLRSKVNLVEIDLIRTGNWTTMIGEYQIPPEAITTYRVTVARPGFGRLLHYPISIRHRLPTIAVPLREKDTPARLNLQELVEKAYTMGRYDRIDYTKACIPLFEKSEIPWAAEMLAGRTQRQTQTPGASAS